MSQSDLSGILRVPQKSVSDLELGRRPTATEIEALERTFGIPVARLLSELPDDVVPPPPSMRLAVLAYREEQQAREREVRERYSRRRR